MAMESTHTGTKQDTTEQTTAEQTTKSSIFSKRLLLGASLVAGTAVAAYGITRVLQRAGSGESVDVVDEVTEAVTAAFSK